ncbi:MAG: hypothetical protein GXO99_01285, partial [Nitrospirae bacterium]|nr:hypothetical protein [Nitrospirota bacterium]
MPMEPFTKIKEHYRFSSADEELIKSVYPMVEKRADRIIEAVEEHIVSMGDQVINEKLKKHVDLP